MAANVPFSMTCGVTMISILHKPPSMAMVETRQVMAAAHSVIPMQNQPCTIRASKGLTSLRTTSTLPPRPMPELSVLSFPLRDGKALTQEVWAHMDVLDQLSLQMLHIQHRVQAATVTHQIFSEDAHNQATKDITKGLDLGWVKEAVKMLFVDMVESLKCLVGQVLLLVSLEVALDPHKVRAAQDLEIIAATRAT